MKRKMILLITAMALTGAIAEAQTTVTVTGGEAGTMSFTVGQPFYQTATSDAGSLAAGVQQAYAISIVDGIENSQISLEAEVFPNPVVDRLNLRVENAADATLRYMLTDNNGRTLASDGIADVQTAIDMTLYVQGVYFLRIDDGERVVKTFKIIKN